MPVSDVFSLFARTAADASITAITVGACIAVMAVGNDSPAAGEFAIVTVPDHVVISIPPLPRPVAYESATPKPAALADAEPAPMQEAAERTLYSAPPEPVITASLPDRQTIVVAGPAITGIASMYNPNNRYDPDAGNMETASGQSYDVDDWTAAIQTDLRAQFGGVHFGKNYEPAFALVQADNKQAIVRINDVGPLLPGRIIDLNERAMRYFDPGLQRGLLYNIQVTPLAGRDWVPGPVVEDRPVTVARVVGP